MNSPFSAKKEFLLIRNERTAIIRLKNGPAARAMFSLKNESFEVLENSAEIPKGSTFTDFILALKT